MEEIKRIEDLDHLKQKQDALLVLYGGENCGVCQSMKPRLVELVSEQYPLMKMVYVDCHVVTELCAQNGVFTLPTLQVFFAGQRFIEEVRNFSVPQVVKDIARPYQMMFSE